MIGRRQKEKRGTGMFCWQPDKSWKNNRDYRKIASFLELLYYTVLKRFFK